MQNIFTIIKSNSLQSNENIKSQNNLLEIGEQFAKKNQDYMDKDIVIKKCFLDDFKGLKDEVITIQNNLKFSEDYNKKLEEVLLVQVLFV